MKKSKLWVVATPIGNREDITLRALAVFKDLRQFIAEDTRQLKQLLQMFSITIVDKLFYSYNKHNFKQGRELILELLARGDVGLVCDRGTPGICDPGYELVHLAREQGFKVVPVPGVSSIVTALSVSGIEGDQFLFLGFIPKNRNERTVLWKQVAKWNNTACFFESPHRIEATLEELRQQFNGVEFLVAREITKEFEQFCYNSLPEVWKGEFVVVFHPHVQQVDMDPEVLQTLLLQRTLSDKQWCKVVAQECGKSSSWLYRELMRLKVEKQ